MCRLGLQVQERCKMLGINENGDDTSDVPIDSINQAAVSELYRNIIGLAISSWAQWDQDEVAMVCPPT